VYPLALARHNRKLRLDQGYEGVEDAYPAAIAKPKRARRNHPLDLVEKLLKQLLSSWRMPVEHGLAGKNLMSLLVSTQVQLTVMTIFSCWSLGLATKDVIVHDPQTGLTFHARRDGRKRYTKTQTFKLECVCEVIV
jgi:hypothetical protein